MATIKELREQAANAATEARSLLEQASSEKDEARASELESQHDAAMKDFDGLTARADKFEKLEAAEKQADEVRQRQDDEKRKAKRPDVSVEVEAEGMDHRTAFQAYMRAGGNEGAMSHEARAVLEARAQVTGTDSAGGYTVPEELQAILTKTMAAWGPMYDEDVATVVTSSTGASWPMPTVDDTGSTAGAHTEGATMTDDGGKDVTFGQKSLEAYEFDTEWLRVSKALADDSVFAMEALLGSLLGERMGRLANLNLTTGSGSSAPHGVATAAGTGHTAASATAITWDEVLDLEHSVDPAYRNGPKVRYMFNDDTLKALRKLKDGDGNYLWQMGNVQGGIPASFNGRPYSVNQAMASIATGNKSMLFGDFGKYYVRKVGAPLIMAAADSKFLPGFGVAGYIRFDGELLDAGAVKALVQA